MLFKLELRRYSRTLFALMTLTAVLLMQGCFWESDDPAPTPDADATGYYTGTISVVGFDDTTTVHALINDNHLMLMSMTQGVLYDGTMTITGNSFTSTAKIYNDGIDTTATTAITGTITAGSQMTGEMTGDSIGSGSFTLTYATSNSETAAVSRITTGAGYWLEYLYGDDSAWTSFKVDLPNSIVSDGGFSAGVFDNCDISSGATITPVSGTNLYSVSLALNTCTGPNQEYTGLATSLSLSAADDTIMMAITGAGYAIIGKFEKN